MPPPWTAKVPLFTDALAILGAARQMSDPVAVAAGKIASEIFPLTVNLCFG
jgi:hypothetical protein